MVMVGELGEEMERKGGGDVGGGRMDGWMEGLYQLELAAAGCVIL